MNCKTREGPDEAGIVLKTDAHEEEDKGLKCHQAGCAEKVCACDGLLDGKSISAQRNAFGFSEQSLAIL